MKQNYLHILQLLWEAYGQERIEKRITVDGAGRMDLHSYSRVLTVLSCLIHGGRLPEQMGLWKRMMTECCKEITTLRGRDEADFAIREIMFSLKMMKNKLSDRAGEVQAWHDELRRIDPYVHYGSVLREGSARRAVHNVNIYNMAGEYLRETEGLTDTGAYFAEHWPMQLERFDRNGMYRDPGCPVLYDLTTRCQIQLMLGFGYDGPFATELDRLLRQGGIATLYMQSSTGQFAYGGRSNQFLFNEALIAANAEYEAVRHHREGNAALAGAFRQSARLAIESIAPWLGMRPPRHLKNKYPLATGYGTEEYGYYDKYMITLGAFLAIAYWFADDSIPEAACPASAGGYVWQTSPSFHKIFAGAGGYSVEVDTAADPDYDATGLGRIHCRSAPSELALSCPLSGGAKYRLHEEVGRTHAAIGAGWRERDGGRIRYLAECVPSAVRLTGVETLPDSVRFTVRYEGGELPGGWLEERYRISGHGVTVEIALGQAEHEPLYIRVPVLATNGRDNTEVELAPGEIKASLNGCLYTVRLPEGAQAQLDKRRFGNRNGEYWLAETQITGGSARLRFELAAPL